MRGRTRPLNLEETADETFLETTFRVEADRIRFRLKNVNVGDTKKVWRYQSFGSYSPVATGAEVAHAGRDV